MCMGALTPSLDWHRPPAPSFVHQCYIPMTVLTLGTCPLLATQSVLAPRLAARRRATLRSLNELDERIHVHVTLLTDARVECSPFLGCADSLCQSRTRASGDTSSLALSGQKALLSLRLKSLQNVDLLLLLLLKLLLLVRTLLNGRSQQLGVLGGILGLSILFAKLLRVNIASRLRSVGRFLNVPVQEMCLG